MGYGGTLLRRRSSSAFDPGDRLASLRGWWQVQRGLVKSGSNFASLTDLTGNGHSGTPVAGKNLPAIIASSAAMGNKPVLRFSRDGTGQPITFTGLNLTPPFTAYIAMTMGAQVGVNQVFFDGTGGAPRLYTYPGGPPDTIVQVGAAQALTAINITSQSVVLTAVFNTSGNLSGVAKSSELLDYQLDLGAYGATATTLCFGIDRNYTPAYALDGDFAELILVSGVDTQAQQHDMLSYLQGLYALGLDFNPPGTLVRTKYAVNLGSTPSSYPSKTLASILSPNGAARIYSRWSPTGAATQGRAQMPSFAQDNSGAGPEVRETVDGYIQVIYGGATYTTEFTTPCDVGHDYELFAVVGGGVVPELAYRCDGTNGSWLPMPLPGAASMAAITPTTGNVNLGGDPSGNSVTGIYRELLAYTDGAQPPGYISPSYAAGALVIAGDSIGVAAQAGAWPMLALRDVTKAYPKPRIIGLTTGTDSYESINSRRASAIDPLLVSGGKNVLIIAGGARWSIAGLGDTPAVAFAAIKTACTNARTAGWNYILVFTALPIGALSETDRTTLNGLITGGGLATYADAIVDVAANATLGVAGANTNTTYYTSNGFGLMLAGGRIVGPLVAAALNSVLP